MIISYIRGNTMNKMKKPFIAIIISVFLFQGCFHYVQGDLSNIDTLRENPLKEQKIEFRVNTTYYAVMGLSVNDPYPQSMGTQAFWGQPTIDAKGDMKITLEYGNENQEAKPMPYIDKNMLAAKKAVTEFLKTSQLKFRDVFKLDPNDVFLNVSMVIHDTRTTDDDFSYMFKHYLSLSLYPAQVFSENVYYAIDVYDKRMLNEIVKKLNNEIKTTGAGTGNEISLRNLDLEGIKPLGSYEYQRSIITRETPLRILFPVSAPVAIIFDHKRALTRAVEDMNGEFYQDLNENKFNMIITYDFARDGKPGRGGLVMTPEQVGYNSTSLTETTVMVAKAVAQSAKSASANSGHGGFKGMMKEMGKDLANEIVKSVVTEYVKSEVSYHVSDEEKNMYVMMVKDPSTKKWHAKATSRSRFPQNEAIASYLTKTARKFFSSQKEKDRWMEEQNMQAATAQSPGAVSNYTED